MFEVIISTIYSRKIVKTIRCKTIREAEKVEYGVLNNLNQRDYFTEIKEIK